MLALLIVLSPSLSFAAEVAIPPAEHLLPDDTVLMITVPDFAKARALYGDTPQSRLWRDPAMKAFTDQFMAKLNEQIIAPLEREWNLRWADCAALPQGQVTFGLVPNGAARNDDATAMLLLVDVRNQRAELARSLAEFKKKWVDSGKTLRIERIRDRDFTVLLASANDIPKHVKDALVPPRLFADPDGGNKPPAPAVPSPEEVKAAAVQHACYIGQADSLLILATAPQPVERILARLAGAEVPALESVAAFAANRDLLFRDAPCFGWINPKPFANVLARRASNPPEPPELASGAPENILFLSFGSARLASALGFGTLKSLAFSLRESHEGSLMELVARAPESERKGIFRLLAGESTESGPPAFVPADAAGFWRWRVNGPKTWTALGPILNDLSPQLASTINWLVDSAAEAAKQKDPDFDLRKTLLASLGDDITGYQKAPPPASAEPAAAPSLYLLGSPQPEQLVAALKALFVLLPPVEGGEAGREFLGRKIYSVFLPVLPGSEPPRRGPQVLFYAAATSGVAMSTDGVLLEEYLRGNEGRTKPLRAAPGFAEAAQHVASAGASGFNYENQNETLRVAFNALRSDTNHVSALSALLPLPGSFDFFKNVVSFRNWMDVSLLPPYERIAKYFHCNVAALSATTDTLSVKYFAPTPPELKRQP